MSVETRIIDSAWIKGLVRDIPDYPSPGVIFRDITPLLGNAEGFQHAVTDLVHRFDGSGC